MKSERPDTLPRLNAQAVEHAYDLEELDWLRPVDRQRRWSPEAIAPLTHLPSFALLPESVRLRYNQLFALGVCEQFIWLEEHVLVRTLERLLADKGQLSPELRVALQFFVEEERKHSAMFRRVLRKAEPDWYASDTFYLYSVSWLASRTLDLVAAFPRVLLVWLWTAIFFEERTVDYSRHYLRGQKQDPDALDPTFADVHRFHFKDEVRHYQLDQHLLAELYEPVAPWRRRVAGRMFTRIMAAYVSPKRTSLRVLARLRREFPAVDPGLFDRLRDELPLLAKSRSFHDIAFSRKAVPKTLQLFARYPELDRVWDLLIAAQKSPATGG